MSSDYSMLCGKKIEGVFDLRCVIANSWICEDEFEVSKISGACFTEYRNAIKDRIAKAPMFEFCILKERQITKEFFIQIFYEEEVVGKVVLMPYLKPGTTEMYFKLMQSVDLEKVA